MSELRQLSPYIRRYRTLIVLGLVFVTISNACSAYYPRLIGATVDVLRRQNFQFNDVLVNIGYILLLTCGSGFFMYLTRKTIIVASRKVEYDLRRDFLGAIELQDPKFFAHTPTGSLMAHATNDISAVREFMGPAIMYSANTATTFVFALILMLRLNVPITLVALIPLPFIALSTFLLGKKIHVAFKSVQQQFEVVTTQSQEVFSGIRIIRAFVREGVERTIFHSHSFDYLKNNLRLARLQSSMMPAMMILVGCSQILVLGFGGMSVIHGSATIGDLTQFFIYLNQLIWPVAAIGWVTNIVQRAAASTGRIMKIMKREPELVSGDAPLSTSSPDIDFDSVSFTYSEHGPKVLDSIRLHIPHNSSLGIVGMVGSGKSTFMKLIPRLYDVSSGRIVIGGHDLRKMSLSELRKHIGVVMQEPFLFSMSIADNIRVAKPDASEEQIIQAASVAQLHEEVQRFPKRYDTIIGERGISLSGGQKQRLAIARALVHKPEILIFDDALSAVDTATERRLLDGLSHDQHPHTRIFIAHRISTVMNCDNIIVLDKGAIRERGTHEELMRANGIYADMYQRQLLEQELEQSTTE